MPQFQFKANATAKEVETEIKEAGASVAGVKWINVNAEGLIVVTADEGFDTSAFVSAVQGVESSISAV